MPKQQLRIATRRSRLALWQAQHVKQKLQQFNPELAIELIKIASQGDVYQDAPLTRYGGKGLFTKILDEAVIRGEADVSVHSMKDVPVHIPEELTFAAYLPREDPCEALICKEAASFDDLPPGAVVGTSSLRRQCLTQSLRPDLEVKPLRGNVETRLRKLEQGQYDAVILAVAGLKRLELTHRMTQYLKPTWGFIPAIGQGIIGVMCRKADHVTQRYLKPLDDLLTRQCLLAERSFNATLEGGCQLPIAAYASICDRILNLTGMIGAPNGSPVIRDWITGSPEEAVSLGKALALRMLNCSPQAVLEQCKS